MWLIKRKRHHMLHKRAPPLNRSWHTPSSWLCHACTTARCPSTVKESQDDGSTKHKQQARKGCILFLLLLLLPNRDYGRTIQWWPESLGYCKLGCNQNTSCSALFIGWGIIHAWANTLQGFSLDFWQRAKKWRKWKINQSRRFRGTFPWKINMDN